MASSRDIRRRIKSVSNTAKITKAMQMVAASMMRRAQQAAVSGRPYARLLNRILYEAVHHAGDFQHPLMEKRDVRKKGVVVITTDRGLCGALNANLLREASKYDAASTVFITAGRKGSQYVARTRRKLAAEFSYKDIPKFAEARAIARFAMDLYINGEVDQVDVVVNQFINTLTQKPRVLTLLPVGEIKPVSTELEGDTPQGEFEKSEFEFLFEPSSGALFESLVPYYVNFGIYYFLLEAKASEFSARMVAMKNATDNAQQLIKNLTVQYNKMRQAAITKELLEISSATMSMG